MYGDRTVTYMNVRKCTETYLYVPNECINMQIFLYRNAPKRTEPHRNAPKCTETYRNVPKRIDMYQNIPKRKAMYNNIRDLTKTCDNILRKRTEFYNVILYGNFYSSKTFEITIEIFEILQYISSSYNFLYNTLFENRRKISL